MLDMANQEKIRLVLLEHWDPLCVGSNIHLSDEYDDYIEPLQRLLAENASNKKLLQKLREFESCLGVRNLSSDGAVRTAHELLKL